MMKASSYQFTHPGARVVLLPVLDILKKWKCFQKKTRSVTVSPAGQEPIIVCTSRVNESVYSIRSRFNVDLDLPVTSIPVCI